MFAGLTRPPAMPRIRLAMGNAPLHSLPADFSGSVSAGPDGSASVAVDTTPVGPGTKVPTLGAFASHTAAIKVVAARPTLSQLQQRVASDYLGMRPNRARHCSPRSERDCDHEREPASDRDFSNHSLLHIIALNGQRNEPYLTGS